MAIAPPIRRLSKMLALRCAVCGAKKGEANRWWVLFHADSNQAAVIASMEEAETLKQGREPATGFHLCGEGCLHRKLSGILMRGVDRPVNGTRLAQPSSPHNAAGKRGLEANSPAARCASGPKDATWLRLSAWSTLRRILGRHNHLERTAYDSSPVMLEYDDRDEGESPIDRASRDCHGHGVFNNQRVLSQPRTVARQWRGGGNSEIAGRPPYGEPEWEYSSSS